MAGNQSYSKRLGWLVDGSVTASCAARPANAILPVAVAAGVGGGLGGILGGVLVAGALGGLGAALGWVIVAQVAARSTPPLAGSMSLALLGDRLVIVGNNLLTNKPEKVVLELPYEDVAKVDSAEGGIFGGKLTITPRRGRPIRLETSRRGIGASGEVPTRLSEHVAAAADTGTEASP